MSPTHAERAAHVASFYGGDWAAYWRDVAVTKAANNNNPLGEEQDRDGQRARDDDLKALKGVEMKTGEEQDHAEPARKAESERG